MFCNLRLLQSSKKIWNYLKFRCLKRGAVMQRYTPQIACLLVTKRCNLKCDYCFYGNILGKGQETDATLDKIKYIFDNPLFRDCIAVDLQGGETLLVKDIDKIVSYLVNRGHIVSLSTNGLLLLDRITDLKRAGISRISVSLYDTNQFIMERDLVKINRIFPVHTSMVLLRSKVEQEQDNIIEKVKFIHGTGCKSIRFLLYRPIGINPRPEEVIYDNLPAYIEFRKKMESTLPGFCFWPVPMQTGKVKKLCPQLWQRITCDMSGNIVICCGTDTVLEGNNSNLFDSEPWDIINHSTLVIMREQLLSQTGKLPDMCKMCNLLGESGW